MNVNTLLQQFSEQQVAGFMLVIARIAPLFLIAPLFSSKMVPARVKGIAAVGLLVLGVSLPFAAGWISDQLQEAISAAMHSLRVA